ncbi:wax ester/triacylglycerol synthase family O-acyltransferase [Amycolatopsis rhizosphaerae]|uniref:Diacylglycerol O-acyltransferase n=1 Tax=Amycolatopsis rhizosphaerae TaxID=2053003 RepID=A0A558DMT8_9PSEU|nr:wax ester/triacylglycerol synthase family O-acyltransferase [Amycolatopsis rhizosphaerae]TVT62273.1 wax ester/triacylglycerol synthase family O-acyltransferase [Amycolatopsis rhizosphaerae]
MPDRLSALDASFLSQEDATTPRHVGGVAVFERAGRFDYEQLLCLIGQRLGYLPRYRQRVLAVPGHLARPVWVDDVDFDLTYHVRRSALPSPGSDEQLFDLVARLMARPMDHDRPLWEAYFVEGLAGDRVALITKTHQAVVDGSGTVELGQLILDTEPQLCEPYEDIWTPRRLPSATQLVLDALGETTQRPAELVENARAALGDVVAAADRLAGSVGGVASKVRSLLRPTPAGPLNAPLSGGRVFAVVRSELDDFRRIRAVHGGTVNDIVLAAVTGALREWLVSRGVAVTGASTVRAMVPMAVLEPGTARFSTAGLVNNEIEAHVVDLPVGEPNPVLRLQHLSHAMRAHTDPGRSVAARAMLKVGGFAPATMHSLAVRAAGTDPGRLVNLVITNSPGPQEWLYAGQARMTEMYPVLPLTRNQALAIGVTSYHGNVYFGLNGDRKAVWDVGNLATMVEDSLEELKGAHR